MGDAGDAIGTDREQDLGGAREQARDAHRRSSAVRVLGSWLRYVRGYWCEVEPRVLETQFELEARFEARDGENPAQPRPRDDDPQTIAGVTFLADQHRSASTTT